MGTVEFDQCGVVEKVFSQVLALGERGDRIVPPMQYQHLRSPRQKLNAEQRMIQVLQIMG